MSKSAITPSFIGLIASMFPGVLPTISFASCPTAKIFCFPYLFFITATTEGSFITIPLPFTKTIVFAVPRSILISFENKPAI